MTRKTAARVVLTLPQARNCMEALLDAIDRIDNDLEAADDPDFVRQMRSLRGRSERGVRTLVGAIATAECNAAKPVKGAGPRVSRAR